MSRENGTGVLNIFMHLRNQWLKDLEELSDEAENSSYVEVSTLKKDINNYCSKEKN